MKRKSPARTGSSFPHLEQSFFSYRYTTIVPSGYKRIARIAFSTCAQKIRLDARGRNGACYIDYSGLHNTDITYYRTSDGKREVDFIIGDETAIEVKSAKHIMDKHLADLRKLKKEGIFSKYIVISREDSPRMLDDGILILPWKDFLEKLWNGEIVT